MCPQFRTHRHLNKSQTTEWYVRERLLPELEAARGSEPATAADSPYRVLTNVAGGRHSIGIAKAEFDAVLVEVLPDAPPDASPQDKASRKVANLKAAKGGKGASKVDAGEPSPSSPPRVLVNAVAVIEAKSNPNDLGKSFMGFQQSLGFLTGEEGCYDPADWKTKRFRTGRFADVAVSEHLEDGVIYCFTPESFASFKREPCAVPVGSMPQVVAQEVEAAQAAQAAQAASLEGGGEGAGRQAAEEEEEEERMLFVSGLHFVTKAGRWLEGMHSGLSSTITSRMASSVEFDVDDLTKVTELYDSVWGEGKAISTEQMVQLFVTRGDWLDQIVVVDKPRRPRADAPEATSDGGTQKGGGP